MHRPLLFREEAFQRIDCETSPPLLFIGKSRSSRRSKSTTDLPLPAQPQHENRALQVCHRTQPEHPTDVALAPHWKTSLSICPISPRPPSFFGRVGGSIDGARRRPAERAGRNMRREHEEGASEGCSCKGFLEFNFLLKWM